MESKTAYHYNKGTNMNYVSGYQLAKMTNQVLENKGLKTIPPQMVYNYLSKDYIKSEIVEGRKMISETVAWAWIQEYVEKRTAKVEVIEVEETIEEPAEEVIEA